MNPGEFVFRLKNNYKTLAIYQIIGFKSRFLCYELYPIGGSFVKFVLIFIRRRFVFNSLIFMIMKKIMLDAARPDMTFFIKLYG